MMMAADSIFLCKFCKVMTSAAMQGSILLYNKRAYNVTSNYFSQGKKHRAVNHTDTNFSIDSCIILNFNPSLTSPTGGVLQTIHSCIIHQSCRQFCNAARVMLFITAIQLDLADNTTSIIIAS